jgi:hypothetical protein
LNEKKFKEDAKIVAFDPKTYRIECELTRIFLYEPLIFHCVARHKSKSTSSRCLRWETDPKVQLRTLGSEPDLKGLFSFDRADLLDAMQRYIPSNRQSRSEITDDPFYKPDPDSAPVAEVHLPSNPNLDITNFTLLKFLNESSEDGQDDQFLLNPGFTSSAGRVWIGRYKYPISKKTWIKDRFVIIKSMIRSNLEEVRANPAIEYACNLRLNPLSQSTTCFFYGNFTTRDFFHFVWAFPKSRVLKGTLALQYVPLKSFFPEPSFDSDEDKSEGEDDDDEGDDKDPKEDDYRSIGRNLTEEARIVLCTQMVKALRSVHSFGIAHRDIFPGNILVFKDFYDFLDQDPSDFVRIIDFGVAQELKCPIQQDSDLNEFKKDIRSLASLMSDILFDHQIRVFSDYDMEILYTGAYNRDSQDLLRLVCSYQTQTAPKKDQREKKVISGSKEKTKTKKTCAETCADWVKRPLKNPSTSRTIQSGGPTYRRFRRACEFKPKMVIENLPSPCREWILYPAYNPKTGRRIRVGGPTYKKLQRTCQFSPLRLASIHLPQKKKKLKG